MAASVTRTGKAGSLTLNSVVLPITGWKAKVNKSFADSTDSSKYNSVTGQLWKSQDPGDLQVEGSFDGHFDLNTTQTDIIALLAAGDGPYTLTLGIDATHNYFSNANADLSDIEVTLKVDGATEVDFSANFKTNGSVTFG